MIRSALALVGLLLASEAAAQTKPIGLFDCGQTPPSWAQFCTLSDLDPPHKWAEAIALSRTRGMLWVLKVGYHEDPRTPITAHALKVRARLDEYGLLPFIAAQSLNEEIYEQWLGGAFAGAPYHFPPNTPNGTETIRGWWSYQHALLKAVIPVPVAWITTIAGHPASTFRPVPANVDVILLDPYIPAGGDFATYVAGVLQFSEQGTTQPIVLVAQWFEAAGWQAPDPAHVAQYMALLQRPRVAALMGFTWLDRPALNMRGLAGLPALRTAVESALRGQ